MKDYLFLQFQYPRRGFIDGQVDFTPSLARNYLAIDAMLPTDSTAHTILATSVRRLTADIFFTTTGAVLVSDALKNLLSDTSVGQFIPTTVAYANGSQVTQRYWVAHQIKKIDCLDYERAEYSGKAMMLESIRHPPRRIVKGLKHIVLDASRIQGADFFLLDNCLFLPNPIISQTLYQTVKKHRLVINATPVEDALP